MTNNLTAQVINRQSATLNGNIKESFKVTKWSKIYQGDLIYIEEGEAIPADIIIIRSSSDNGECFVQTSNLDGERTLKHKQCIKQVMNFFDRVGP